MAPENDQNNEISDQPGRHPSSQVTLGVGATYVERTDLQEFIIIDADDLATVDTDDKDSLGTWPGGNTGRLVDL